MEAGRLSCSVENIREEICFFMARPEEGREVVGGDAATVRRAMRERVEAALYLERCARGLLGRGLKRDAEAWWATQRAEAEEFAEQMRRVREAKEAEEARRGLAATFIEARCRGRADRRMFYALQEERARIRQARAASRVT